MSEGTELMQRLSTGELSSVHSEVAIRVKQEVTNAFEELVRVGARIRPLMLGGVRVGWVRSLGFAERNQITLWAANVQERVFLTLKYATSLTADDINNLDNTEINSILRIIQTANTSDISLYPYVSPYATTYSSVKQWDSRTDELWTRKRIEMFDGRILTIMLCPDLLHYWAAMASCREHSIQKLEHSLDISYLIQSTTREQYSKELVKALNEFNPDRIEPWLEVVNTLALDPNLNLQDGFGHAHQDSSLQGLMREMHGMMEGDKHEKLMQSFYTSQLKAAEERTRQIEEKIRRSRQQAEMASEPPVVCLTDSEMAALEQRTKAKSPEAQAVKALQVELVEPEESKVAAQNRILGHFEK